MWIIVAVRQGVRRELPVLGIPSMLGNKIAVATQARKVDLQLDDERRKPKKQGRTPKA